MKISIVIPAHNEEGCIEETVSAIKNRLMAENIPHDILVINDNSQDDTENILLQLCARYDKIRYLNNGPPNGFGHAVHMGLNNFAGEAVAIVMADGSDSPDDIVKYYEKLLEGYDCVFGSRFIKGSRIIDYPYHKLILNRLANWFIKILFRLKFNDVTNAFKAYRRHVIQGIRPIISYQFNITVELPLKAIVRGYSYTIVPISWKNRTTGISKLKIKEMGSRYLFIVLYILLEKYFSRGDYLRKEKISVRKDIKHG
jgi:dolichol-phosphate mannosyltransferase